MEIIPKLNINAHPKNVDNYSMVDSVNLMLSDDNTIQTERGAKYNQVIYNAIVNKYNQDFNIVYCVECNVELVLFVQHTDNESNLSIFRYNEKENKCLFITDKFEYKGGNLLGTFTYNKNNLIIAVSEYFDDDVNKVPLKVINLGEFNDDNFLDKEDINQLNNPNLHSLLPSIKIPSVEASISTGNAIKGWYYIFIRYKIDNSTYTQWFNTNQSIFVDSFNKENILTYSGYDGGQPFKSTAYINISNDKDIVDKSFNMIVNDLDNTYANYQIGLILLNKTTTKAYCSSDLNIDNSIIKFENFKDYSINDIIIKYNNYYNIKTMDAFNNKLYIGNYEEFNNNINVSNIELEISAKRSKMTDISDGNITYWQDEILYKDYPVYKYSDISNATNDSPIDNIKFNKNTFIYKGKTFDGVKGSLIVNNGSNYLATGDENVLILCWLYKYENGVKSKKVFAFNTTLNNCVILKDDNYDSAINLAILDNKTDNTVYKPWESYFTEGQLYQDKDSYNEDNYTFNIFVGSRINDFTDGYNQQYLFGIYDNPFTKSEIEDNTYNDIFAIDDSKIDWDNVISNEKNTSLDNTDINIKNYVLSPNTSPYEWYSFYVHFVNKYGEISNGIPINDFNLKIINENDDNNKINGAIPVNELNESGKPIIKDFVNNVVIYSIINQSNLKLLSLTNVKTFDNKYDVKLLSDKIINNFVYNFYFKLNSIPNDFIGYFISYEKIDKTIIHDGFAQYVKDEKDDNTYYINLFNNKLNYKPAIDFNFNKIVLNDITVDLKDFKDAKLNAELNIKQLGLENFVEEIIDKQLIVAEESFSDDNDHNTRIKINCTNINNKLKTGSNYFCLLINDDVSSKYINTIKELIPCSNVTYKENEYIKANVKNAFISKNHILYYKESIIYNDAESKFILSQNSEVVQLPYYPINYVFYDDILNETVRYNNKPETIVVPNDLPGSGDVATITTYTKNKIIEYKNSVDLLAEKNVSYYESYPIVLNYKNNKFSNKFYNTIRRSFPILDESYEISWRKFGADIYKNVGENKGDIIKVVNTGNILLVHTQHSLFSFDGTDSIKSVDDKIQLASIDIWDVNHKELFSSKLGFGGLSKEHHGIVGAFGYIWFDADNYRLYRLDGAMKMSPIDTNIINFIQHLKPNDVIFGNDSKHNRLLINIIKDKVSTILSYNTVSNTFVSRHTYKYKNTFNTKNNIYILDRNSKYLINFVENIHNNYEMINDDGFQQYAQMDIICKDNYEVIKFLNSISYKVSKHTPTTDVSVNNYLPVEGIDGIKYAGDFIRIYSKHCDTGDIRIIFDTINEFNNPDNYAKPYWHLGNWNFNAIRDKLADYLNENANTIADGHSRIYGNYFVVRLIFNTTDCVKIESLSHTFDYE